MTFHRKLLPLWIASLILFIAVCGYWMTSDFGEIEPASVPGVIAVARDTVPQSLSAIPAAVEPVQQGSEPIRPPVPSPRMIRVSELVTEYLRIEKAGERGDLARSIASMDDAESLREIVTLFHRSRNPAEREALIAALGDTDFSTELDGKLSLLASALVGQARNVRSAALGVVGRIEDPRALALVKKVARTDPDHEVRDAAKAFIGAQ